jgi:uncharacterized membrane protein YdbT with pleckstrin-like domain
MHCNACGKEVPEGSSFCPQCGAPLAHDGIAPPRMQAGGAHGSARDVPEDELWSGTYSPKAMAGHFVGAAIVSILAIAVGSFFPPFGWIVSVSVAALIFAYLGLQLLYRRMTVRYRLTTHRFFTDTGLLTRTNDRIQVIAIDDVQVRQGVFDRLFDVGTIELKPSEKSEIKTQQGASADLFLIGIEQPRHVADLIDGARRAERNRRGLYMTDM